MCRDRNICEVCECVGVLYFVCVCVMCINVVIILYVCVSIGYWDSFNVCFLCMRQWYEPNKCTIFLKERKQVTMIKYANTCEHSWKHNSNRELMTSNEAACSKFIARSLYAYRWQMAPKKKRRYFGKITAITKSNNKYETINVDLFAHHRVFVSFGIPNSLSLNVFFAKHKRKFRFLFVFYSLSIQFTHWNYCNNKTMINQSNVSRFLSISILVCERCALWVSHSIWTSESGLNNKNNKQKTAVKFSWR